MNKTNLTESHPNVASQWHPTKNGELSPYDYTYGSRKKVWWICEKEHEWEAKISVMTKSTGCPYCFGMRVWRGFNDIHTTSEKLSGWILNKEDGFKYSKGSKVRLNWKCECGQVIKNKSPFIVDKDGLGCPSCSDGKSYPEKIVYQLLKQLNIEFVWEKTFTWSQDKRYDFYIKNLNIIIEVHGKQHYSNGFDFVGGRTLEEEQENDRYKRELALNNNIEHYIVVDARKSELEWIKESILNSQLIDIFNLSSIQWEEIDRLARRKLITELEELWCEYKSIGLISKKTGITQRNIKRYLKGVYIKEEDVDYEKPSCEIIIKYCTTTNTVEELDCSVKDYDLDTLINMSEIKEYFIFRKDYFSRNKEQIDKRINNLHNPRKIYQLDYNYNIVKVWNSDINFIAEELNLKSTNLYKHLKGVGEIKTFADCLWSYDDELENRIKYFNDTFTTNTKYFIYQFDLDGNLLKQWSNTSALGIYNNIEINFKHIKKKVLNGSNYYKGFIFIKNSDYANIKDRVKFFNTKKHKYKRLLESVQ